MQSQTQDIHTMRYEEAFQALEEIVYGLETNSKTLEEALALYERGQALAAHCAALLDQAELRVRQLNGPASLDKNDDPF